jgi:predicted SprT family Zn-dependent metalloprotease
MGFIINNRDKIWPMGEIPFLILSSDISADANRAINHWNQVIGHHICYIPRTTQTDYVCLTSTTTGHSISSGAGRTGGVQNITINSERVNRLSNVDDKSGLISSVILHELAHAAGLLHEHQRHDRDEHVTIHWQNIDSGRCKDFWSTASYDTARCESVHSNRQQQYRQAHCTNSYDFDSVMHYLSTHSHGSNRTTPPDEISSNRTITRNSDPVASYRDRNFEPFQGHLRATLSEGDKGALRTLYPLLNWNAIINSGRNPSNGRIPASDTVTRPQAVPASNLEGGVIGNSAPQKPLGVIPRN